MEQVDNQEGRNQSQQQQPRITRQQHIIDIDHSTTHLIIGDSLLKGIYSEGIGSSVNETASVYHLPGADIERMLSTLTDSASVLRK